MTKLKKEMKPANVLSTETHFIEPQFLFTRTHNLISKCMTDFSTSYNQNLDSIPKTKTKKQKENVVNACIF